MKFSGFEFATHLSVGLEARDLNLSWHQFPLLKRVIGYQSLGVAMEIKCVDKRLGT